MTGLPAIALLVIVVLAVALLSGCGGAEAPAPAAAAPAADAPGAEASQRASLDYPKWETVAPGENDAYNQRESLVRRGRLVYDKYCVGCHGAYGDGNGAAAARLITKPRDFTSGIYKFRSTDSSSLPLEADLHRTIDGGLARVSMPAFPLMPETDKVAVIEYIKGFYPQWEQRKGDRQLVPIPQAPSDLGTEDRIERGRIVYLVAQCWKCHGTDGRGTGATQTEYTDAWGNPQRAFDFTRGELKGGSTPADIYRTFHTGLRSIMPSFGGDTLARVTGDGFSRSAPEYDPVEVTRLMPYSEQFPADGPAVSALTEAERLALAERNSWDLVAYILSLRTEFSTRDAVLATASSGG